MIMRRHCVAYAMARDERSSDVAPQHEAVSEAERTALLRYKSALCHGYSYAARHADGRAVSLPCAQAFVCLSTVYAWRICSKFFFGKCVLQVKGGRRGCSQASGPREGRW